ncbi:MAG: hypothetical protein WAV46_04325 [Candidatus Moraniibacteriota bacterium]
MNTKFRRQELILVGWVIGLTVAGIWLGILFLSLDNPKKYENIFSTINTALSVIVSIIVILIGINRHKNNQLFELAINSHYSVSLYNERKAFYETYIDTLNKLDDWLWINGLPGTENEKEFQNIIIEFIKLRKKYEKWLPNDDLKSVEEINKRRIAFMADNHYLIILQNSDSLTAKQNNKRMELIEKASQTIEELYSKNGFEKVRNELKEAMGINAVGNMQKFIIDASEKYMKE